MIPGITASARRHLPISGPLKIPFSGGEYAPPPIGTAIFGNFRGVLADTYVEFGTNITTKDGLNFFIFIGDYETETQAQVCVTDAPAFDPQGTVSQFLEDGLQNYNYWDLVTPSGSWPISALNKAPLGNSYAWLGMGVPMETYHEIVANPEECYVIQTGGIA